MKEPINLEPLFPDPTSAETLGRQLVRRIRSAVKSGFFPEGSRLLPSRELAKRLGVARNTVTSALEQLIAEGYLEARVGSGTFVTKTRGAPHTLRRPVTRTLPADARRVAVAQAHLEAVGNSYGPLRVGAPDLGAFPLRTWQRLSRRNLADAEFHLDYVDPCGLPALREAISRHVAQFRGVVAEPERIIVVEGTQGALHLIAFALGQRGTAVTIEDPCYQLARSVFDAHGFVLYGVDVDRDGLRTSRLPRASTLAYVTPSHQFPLGGAMPVTRRIELLDWARQRDAHIIEDDYDSEFGAHPLPALQSLDRDERVIYVGTLSKTLAPGLRAGYVVVPSHLAETFRFLRAITSLGASGQLQKTIADFISGGNFTRHIRRMTARYDRRRRILADVLQTTLPSEFHLGPAQAGLHVAVLGPAGFDDVAMVNAMPPGHRVLPLSTLCVGRRDCRGLLVGFSAGSDRDIADAATRLATRLRTRTSGART